LQERTETSVPLRKTGNTHILLRYLTVVIAPLWVAASILAILWVLEQRCPRWFRLLFVTGFPLVYLSASLWTSRFAHSSFGPCERTPFPDEPPLADNRRTSGRIGWFGASAPLVRWTFFREGVGVRMLGFGRVFVPYRLVREARVRSFGVLEIHHDAPEVRSPLILPRDPARWAREVLD
jgi:hypothetical protein